MILSRRALPLRGVLIATERDRPGRAGMGRLKGERTVADLALDMQPLSLQ